MTIHIAVALPRANRRFARWLSLPQARRAANDNCLPLDDATLKAALRHFAAHGLAAADKARDQAEKAFFAGNRDEYRHWLEICRALDKRMAASIRFRETQLHAR